MDKEKHILTPAEETEHDTSVFMRVAVLSGVALLAIIGAALVVLYITNGKIIPAG